eukprot:1161479-Pelagomonas_calceolata.AAC.11
MASQPAHTCVMLCEAAKSCDPMTTFTGCVMKWAASCCTPVGHVALNIIVCLSDRTCRRMQATRSHISSWKSVTMQAGVSTRAGTGRGASCVKLKQLSQLNA